MKPTVGRIVLYHTTEAERKAMEDSFKNNKLSQNVSALLPAIVVAVWSDVCINLKVFVDGIGELWITSANEVNPKLMGNDGYSVEGKWSWPEIKNETKDSDGLRAPLLLDYEVFPSTEKTISVAEDADYGGAHQYFLKNSLGFSEGKAKYVESFQQIQFVQKNIDGSMIPGVQSEQLVYVLLDRCTKLNAKFPSDQNLKMIDGLNLFLDACKERVQDRIDRGVMGDLKK